MNNYIKFQRGSKEAYERVLKNGQIDDNTLYSIYDSDNDNSGKLYLGKRLIGQESSLELPEELQNKINSIKYNDDNKTMYFDGYIQANNIIGLDLKLLIKSVNPNYFSIDENKQLNLNFNELKDPNVGDVNDLKDRVNENSTIVEEINYIKEHLLWEEIKEE